MRRIFNTPRAKGYRKGNSLRVVVSFDPETHQQICDLAEKHKVSFAEIVRELVDHSLLDIEEGIGPRI